VRSRGRDRQLERLWTSKLLTEFFMLERLGCLDQEGRTFCRECGLELERPHGWELHLVCVCGWELHDL
jgi:hypothetical protein